MNLVANAFTELFATITPANFEVNLLGQVTNFMNLTSGWTYVAVVLLYLVITFYQIKFFIIPFKIIYDFIFSCFVIKIIN